MTYEFKFNNLTEDKTYKTIKERCYQWYMEF